MVDQSSVVHPTRLRAHSPVGYSKALFDERSIKGLKRQHKRTEVVGIFCVYPADQ